MTVAVLYFALDLRRADLRVPLDYAVGGDVYLFLPLFKGIADNGWYLQNPWLGAPGTMELYDFPMTETGLMLGIKLLIWLTGDPFLAANIYFLLTFVAAAIAALYALRSFGVAAQPAVAASVLFAFLPYHFWHGPFHPNLSTYHAIPLATMVAAWLAGGGPLLWRRDEAGRLRRARSGRAIPVVVACVLTAISGPYYAFFGAFLIGIGGLIGLLRRPGLDRVLDAIAAAGLVAVLFAAQLIPNVVHAAGAGANPTPANRSVLDYYQYGLRVVDLVRPVSGHRLPWLETSLPTERTGARRDLAWLYNETSEARVDTPLGTLGTIGFLAAMALGLAAPCAATRRSPALGDLGKLVLAALLLGLLGGFSELLARFVTTKIRGYGRLSIFIAFGSLATLALLASRPRRGGDAGGGGRRRWPGWARPAAIWAVTALGLLDQIPPVLTPDHARDAASFRSDKEFVARIEAALPPGSMVFQLPPNSYPEFGRHFRMYDYDLFRGYLHSQRLRWSYGALRGRSAERFHSRLAALPTPRLVDELVAAGFAGVYVNRKGHEADGRAVIDDLRRKLGEEPITSADGELVFFRLPTRHP